MYSIGQVSEIFGLPMTVVSILIFAKPWVVMKVSEHGTSIRHPQIR